MNSHLTIQSATQGSLGSTRLIRLVLSDFTQAAIYLDDGSPKSELHDLLDAWLADYHC